MSLACTISKTGQIVFVVFFKLILEVVKATIKVVLVRMHQPKIHIDLIDTRRAGTSRIATFTVVFKGHES